jgi:hypothetical protein
MKHIIIIGLLLNFFLINKTNSQTAPSYNDSAAFNSTIPFIDENGVSKYSYGYYYQYYGCGSNCIKNPLIIVEGIDPSNERWWEQIYNAMNQQNVADNLHKEGYDIIALNFENSVDYIQRNAMLVVELIQRVNQMKANCGSTEKNIIIGPSMGALVVRYALAYMEANGINHDCRLYFSFDGPHRGANIPIGLQNFTDFMLDLADNVGSISNNLSNKLAEFRASTLDAPATQQMLIYNYKPNAALRKNLLISDFNSIGGYPQNVRKVSIANGSGNGTAQAPFVNGKIFSWHHNTYSLDIDVDIWALKGGYYYGPHGGNPQPVNFDAAIKVRTGLLFKPTVASRISTMPNSVVPIDHAPGGYTNFPQIYRELIESATVKSPMPMITSTSPTTITTVYPEYQLFQPAQTPGGDNCNFIPTISAHDINTTNYFYNIFNIQNFPYPNNSSITPFNAIYTPAHNMPHVLDGGVDVTVAGWFLNEIGSISRFSLNELSQEFNYAESSSSCCFLLPMLTQNLKIKNGGILRINGNKPVNFANSGCPLGHNKPYNFHVGFDDPSQNTELTVESGGQLILGNISPNRIAIVRFKAGSTLKISAGGKLIINNNSKLIIEPGAKLIYEEGAIIELNGNDAVLEISGELHLGQNANFTFTFPPSGNSGYIRFNIPNILVSNSRIVAAPGSRISLIGKNKTDEILRIEQESLIIPEGLTSFTFSGTCSLKPTSKLEIKTQARIYSSRITSTTSSVTRGLVTYGFPAEITGTDFIGGGINALSFHNNNRLNIRNCNFDPGCSLTVVGGALEMSNSKFNNSALLLQGQFSESNITGCRFTNCEVTLEGTAIARVKFASTVIEKSNMESNPPAGLEVYNSNISLKCSSVKNYEIGVYSELNSMIDMSTFQSGGHVNLSGTQYPLRFNRIFALHLNRGNNNFNVSIPFEEQRECDKIPTTCWKRIQGTIAYYNPTPYSMANGGTPVQSGCPPAKINAHENKWQQTNTFNDNLTDVITAYNCSGVNVRIPVEDNRPSNPKPCGFYDPNGPVDFGCERCGEMIRPGFPNIRIDVALKRAEREMENPGIGSRERAFLMFSEIVKYNFRRPETSDEVDIKRIAYKRMYEAISSGIEKGEIPKNLNNPAIAELIGIQNNLLANFAADSEQAYSGKISIGLDRAQTFRLLNRRDLAIQAYDELLQVADEDDRELISRFKCFTQAEESALAFGMDADFYEQNIEACLPRGMQRSRPFSQLEKINNPNYSDSLLSINEDKDAQGLKIYPNPASNELNVEFNLSNSETPAVQLFNLSGSIVYNHKFEQSLTAGNNNLQINTALIPPGIYFLEFKATGVTTRQKVVIIK